MNSTDSIYRILVIDDTPSIHDDFRKVLGTANAPAEDLGDLESQLFGDDANEATTANRYEIDSATQGEEGAAKLRQAIADCRPYAMAFVDMRMPPGWDGVQTIRELWKIEPGLQVVICTAYSDYTPAQIAAELKLDGRMMILRKPFDQTEIRQLTATLCDKWQVARHKAELETLIATRTAEFKHAALHDSLTKLPNRALFSDRLNQAFLQCRREPERRFAVMFIDLDNFKTVNDSLGHDAGDSLLQQVAERLSGSLREADTLALDPVPEELRTKHQVTARLGGDEFAILLDNIRSDADAARVAQRLVEAVSRPFKLAGREFRCGASIGITTNNAAYDSAEAMIRDADTAMYHAKQAGRGRFAMFDPGMHRLAVERLTFESDLRAAIEHGQIQVHYQPIVDATNERLVGFEALARWNHPTRGNITPAEFIPVAEETGLIHQLGLQVLKTACSQLVSWQTSMPDAALLTMSVNLSHKQLTSRSIIDSISQSIHETGIRPQCLKMEVTESCVMADPQAALEVLKQIQAIGVQLHIDDFGTGYSSLSCLQAFPLDGLKMDRSFLQNIAGNPVKNVLLNAIVGLAHGMGMPLVSEGVETREQASLLRSMGCDQAQGYFYAKPMDAANATQFIKKQKLAAA